MNEVLHPFISKFVVVYFDDILVYSGTRDSHHQHLRQVLDALREEKLYAHPKKCSFFTSEVTFLDFIVSERGVFADPEKVRAIVTWPRLGSMRVFKVACDASGVGIGGVLSQEGHHRTSDIDETKPRGYFRVKNNTELTNLGN